jgi:hypothetical protein
MLVGCILFTLNTPKFKKLPIILLKLLKESHIHYHELFPILYDHNPLPKNHLSLLMAILTPAVEIPSAEAVCVAERS